MGQFQTTPGLAALEDAMGALDEAAKRAAEVRARLGYLISPEQRRALNDLEAAHTRIYAYHKTIHEELKQLKNGRF